MVSYLRKALRGSSVIFILSVVASLIAYGTKIYLARNLSLPEYGLFFAVFSFISFFFFIREFGLNTALVKYVVDYKEKKEFGNVRTCLFTSVIFQLFTSTLLILGLIFFSEKISAAYFKSPVSWTIIKILFVYILFSVLFRAIKSVFQAFQKMKLYALVEPTKNILVFLSVVFFFHQGRGLIGVAMAYSLASAILVLLFLPSLFRVLKKVDFFSGGVGNDGRSDQFSSAKPSKSKVAGKLIWFGFPFMLTGFSGRIIGYLDVIILTYFASLSEVGVYNAILPTAMILLFLSRPLSVAIFPIVTELWAKKDLTRISLGISLLYQYMFLAAIPLVISMMVFSDFFLLQVFGEQFLPGVVPFQILLMGVLLIMLAKINNTVLAAIGRPSIVMQVTVLSSALNVILNIVLIPTYGIYGAASATTVSYATLLVLSTRQVLRFLSVKLPYSLWFRTFILGGLFLSATVMVRSFLASTLPIIPLRGFVILILTIIPSVLLYVLLAFTLRVVNIKELKGYWKVVVTKS